MITGIAGEMIPLAFPFFGLKAEFTKESLAAVEACINELYPPPHDPMASTMIPFAVHFGQTIVETIPGSRWDFNAKEFHDCAVIVPMPNGFHKVFPFMRVARFWHNREYAMSAMWQMLNLMNLGLWDASKMQPGETLRAADGTEFTLKAAYTMPGKKGRK